MRSADLAEHVERNVAAAPPLTPAQRDVILIAFAGLDPTEVAA